MGLLPLQEAKKNNFLPGMDASILVLCANRHFTGVTVTFYRCFGRFTGFRDGQGGDCTIRVAKTKALISFAVTAKLICVFVYAYAKSRFSHVEAHFCNYDILKSCVHLPEIF